MRFKTFAGSGRRQLAVWLAALLIVSAHIGAAAQTAKPSAEDMATARQAIEEAMQRGERGKVWRILKEEFPEDYRRLVGLMEEAVASGSAEGLISLMPRLLGEMEKLRRTHGPHLATAPDPMLKRLMSSMAEVYSHIYEQDGADACSQYVVSGVPAPSLFGAESRSAEMERKVLTWEAIAAGKRDPVERGAPVPADWKSLGEQMAALNSADEAEKYLQAIGQEDPSDGTVCPAYAAYFSALATLEGEAGERLRATIAKGLF